MFARCEFISSTDSCNLSSFSTVVASGASVFSKISESILISVRCKASCSCSVVEGRREITRAMMARTVLSRLKNLSKVIFECLESIGKVSVALSKSEMMELSIITYSASEVDSG